MAWVVINHKPPILPDTTTVERIEDPMEHALFMTPTAKTPPGESVFFRNIQLFYMSMTFSPTSTTAITAILIPIGFVNLAALNVKQEVLGFQGGRFLFSVEGSALYGVSNLGSVMLGLEESSRVFFVRSTGIGSYQTTPRLNLHAHIGIMWNPAYGESHRGNIVPTFGVGADFRVSSRVKLIGEFISGFRFEDPDDLRLLNAGIRFHGRRLAFDAAYMFPISHPKDRLPFATIGYRF